MSSKTASNNNYSSLQSLVQCRLYVPCTSFLSVCTACVVCAMHQFHNIIFFVNTQSLKVVLAVGGGGGLNFCIIL